MPISLPLIEPETADYIYVDSENRVHLLLAIAAGETIGLENTAKTAMQIFFCGEHSEISDGTKEQNKSALHVLGDYKYKLLKDIGFLHDLPNYAKILEKKIHRLDQIEGYIAILDKIKHRFDSDDNFPNFPQAIHELLQKQTNCLSVHLSPEPPNFRLCTKSPVFTLSRPQRQRVRLDDGRFVDAEIPAQGLGVYLHDNLLAVQASIEPEINVEKINLSAQFFLAITNIYCKTQGLSNENFGPLFDVRAEYISKRITLAVSTDSSVEDELLKIINELHGEFGLCRLLEDKDKAKIKEYFVIQYNVIKDFIHFDEFIFFFPDIQGDFFNYKNKISIHFLDLINFLLLSIESGEEVKLKSLIEQHKLLDNVAQLKIQPIRALVPNSLTTTGNFTEFLELLNEHTVNHFASYLCSQIEKISDITTKLSFEELDALFNHPKWTEVEKEIHRNKPLRAHHIRAIDYAKNYIAMNNEKFLALQGDIIDKARNLGELEKTLLKTESQYLGPLAAYKCLHHLNSKWWNKEGMRVIQQLPVDYYTYDNIDFINATVPSSWDLLVLKAVQMDKPVFNQTIDFAYLRVRGQTVKDLEASGVPLELQKSLLHLNKKWWTYSSSIDELISSGVVFSKDTVNFLNTISPEQLDDNVLNGIVYRGLVNGWGKSKKLEKVRDEGMKYKLLGDLYLNFPLLDQLNIEWWTEHRLAPIKSLDNNCYTPFVVSFLNTIHPYQLDQQLIRGIQNSDTGKPIFFSEAYALGATNKARYDKHDHLLEKINAAKHHYAEHTKKRWLNIERTASKNKIIQEHLEKAIAHLVSETPDVGKAKDIIISAQSIINEQFGDKKTWSWFKLSYVVPESKKVLNKLIGQISAAELDER